MSWLEVTIEVNGKYAQEYSDILENIGALAVSFLDAANQPLLEPLPGTTPLWNQVKVVGLFSEETEIASLNQTLISFFPDNIFAITHLADQQWTRTWLEHFHPMQFGKHLWVAPLEESTFVPPKESVVVRLDPGLAFGTGTHQTTALCLEWLDAHPPLNAHVIDYGCGSGILGIAALQLGAQKVWAIDYDPQALLSTRENAIRNHLIETQLITCLPNEFPSPPPLAKVVLANILAEPLISLAHTLRDCCELGGSLVLSGLLSSQAQAVIQAYELWFSFGEIKTKEDWVLLEGIRIN